MRLLYLIKDSFPSPRPDVLVLFGQRLARLGVVSDVVATGSPKQQDEVSRWPAGQEYVSPDSLPAIRKHRESLLLDIRMLRQGGMYDVIVVRDKILTAFIALLLGSRTRTCYWMSYPFPDDDLVRARIALKGPLFRAALKARGIVTGWMLYRFVIPRARHVFVQSDKMRESVSRRSGRQSGITAVPMGVDEQLLSPVVSRRMAPQDGQALQLVYLGSLDRGRHIGFLLQVLARLDQHAPGQFRLALVGGASSAEEYAAVQAEVASLGLNGITEMTGQISREQAWQVCARSHIGLSAIPRGELFDVSSPTKAVEYLALGLPVVVNDIPDQQYLIDSTGAGRCVPMQVDDFCAAILDARADYANLAMRAADARQWVVAERGYNRLAANVAKVLDSLLEPDTRRAPLNSSA